MLEAVFQLRILFSRQFLHQKRRELLGNNCHLSGIQKHPVLELHRLTLSANQQCSSQFGFQIGKGHQTADTARRRYVIFALAKYFEAMLMPRVVNQV